MRGNNVATTAQLLNVSATGLRCVLITATLTFSLWPQSVTDGSTPTAIAPGSPAGSYSLSGIDTVNLYSGKVNLLIPIHTISGRGKAGYTMTLPIQRNWIIKAVPDGFGGQQYLPMTDELPGNAFWFNQMISPYQAGHLAGRHTYSLSSGIFACPDGTKIVYHGFTLTRLTWSASDGTETDFVDALTGGNTLAGTGQCGGANQGASRGTVFVATDGSAATFISTSPIFDSTLAKSGLLAPSGSLFLADGTRYDIGGGQPLAIYDANGNAISASLSTAGAPTLTVQDPIGRVTNVYYGNISFAPVNDVIVFSGVGGRSRAVVVNYVKMDTVMAGGQTTQDRGCLFPELPDAYGTFDPWVVSSVSLPNNQSYAFLYNSYGDVVRVTLPTGGAIEYDFPTVHSGTCPTSGDGTSGVMGQETIQRRVTERRVKPDGANIEQTTDYVPTFGSPQSGQTTVLVKNLNSGAVATQEKHYYFGDPTQAPSMDPVTYNPWQQGKEYQTDYLDASSTRLRTSADTWQQHSCTTPFSNDVACWFGNNENDPTAPLHYPAIVQSDTTLENNQVTRTTYGYDQYNNKTSIIEYDYGAGSPGNQLRQTALTYLTNGYDGIAVDVPSTIHLRRLITDKKILTPAGGTVAETQFIYDETSLTAEAQTPPGYVAPGTAATCTTAGRPGACRGNVTSEKHWLNTNSQWLTTTRTYDNVGNVLSVMDPNNTALTQNQKKTTYAYSDSGTTIANVNPSYAFPNTITNALGQSTTLQYDYYIGQPTSSADPNGVSTTFAYGVQPGNVTDGLDRLDKVTRGSGAAQTAFVYTDTPNAVSVTTKSDKDALADGIIQSQVFYDGLGRKKESRQLGDCNYIATLQTYDFLGRAYRVSNPYRPCANESAQYTTTTFDALGRVTRVTAPDNSAANTSYAGNQATVTDPSSVSRTTQTDAAGRIQQVVETKAVGSVTTNYLYDVLDNLTEVCQGVTAGTAAGVCTGTFEDRRFVYDSMSRLTSATNVETANATTYGYDNNSNLLSKLDANSVTTSLAYDPLNRVVTKNYSDSTPAVTYCYDGDTTVHAAPDPPRSCAGAPTGANAKLVGRLTRLSSSASQTAYNGFNALGTLVGSTQTTGGTPYPFSYSYNLANGLTQVTYPSNRVINYTYDSLGRAATVNGTPAGGSTTHYASNISYASHGPIARLTLGDTLVENRTISLDRLQPTTVTLGTSANPTSLLALNFYYCPSQQTQCSTNNGNMLSQTINPLGVTQTYNYTDGLNRLNSAKEMSGSTQIWSQTYGYDDFANRALVSGSSDPSVGMDLILRPLAFSTTTVPFDGHNHWTAGGVTYDNKGNLSNVEQDSNNSFLAAHDAENRQTSVTARVGGTQSTTNYSYDGDGKRVKKVTGNTTTTYVYDAGGQLAAEYLSGGTNPDTGTQYLTADHLGSTRVAATIASGVVTTVNRFDYLPFGQEIPTTWNRSSYVPDSSETMKFTGKERDAETGLDYFEARYFSGAQGRFISPDPVFFQAEMLTDPQRFNQYSYVRNNPLRYIDPTGEKIELTGATEQERKKQLAAIQSAVGKGGDQLTIIQDADSGKYFVAIDGDAAAFSKISDIAAGIAQVIQNPEIAKFAFAAGYENLSLNDANGRPLNLRGEKPANGVTGRDSNGQLWIYVLRPSECCGSESGADFGRRTMGGLLDFLGITSVSADQGTVTAHEAGHALYRMQIGAHGSYDPNASNKAALDLENAARKARDPNAPVRTRHP
jgi:RHS repeat-associated protein